MLSQDLDSFTLTSASFQILPDKAHQALGFTELCCDAGKALGAASRCSHTVLFIA